MKQLNLLLSSGGRRVALMECLREALYDKGVTGRVMAVDSSLDAPTVHLADQAWRVPRCTDADFTAAVLTIALREHVHLIIPTIDSELIPLAENRRAFALNGVSLSVSDPATVQICRDKVLTHRWLVDNGFPTVRQSSPEAVLSNPKNWELPMIVKPRDGSASKGVRVIRSFRELDVVSELENGLIVQEIASGVEYTINVFVNKYGKCACAVPHERIEVRAGEVSKAVTVKDLHMMRLASNIAEALPGARGMLNIQCFRSSQNDLKVIEINARVGGGYPVAHHAGARFTHWLLEEQLDLPSSAAFDDWQDDLAMLRYDHAVFRPGAQIRAANCFDAESKAHYTNGTCAASDALSLRPSSLPFP